MTKAQAIQLVMLVRASFRVGPQMLDETARIYEDMILDLDFELAKAAIGRLIQSSKFLPSIAEIREAARETTQGPARSGAEAWGDVVQAIRLVGAYRSPKFADPIVAHAVASLGWLALCLDDNEPALRARFIEAYEAAAKRERTEQALSPELRLQGSQLRPQHALNPVARPKAWEEAPKELNKADPVQQAKLEHVEEQLLSRIGNGGQR